MKEVLIGKSFIRLCFGIFLFSLGITFADYDVVLTGVNQFQGQVSYSNKSIYIDEGAFVEYDNLSLDNCVVDVNGFVEINLSLEMSDSVFVVYGDFLAEPGSEIYETGASSLIATGDSIRSGQITLKGGLYNPIQIESDYSQTEFIVIEEDASPNSVLQNIDFYGGWCNIQIYNQRLNHAISNCRFIESDYGVYQDGYDKVTDVRFCFFYWNSISVYAQVNGTAQEEVAFKFDNLTIDNNFQESSYGVVLVGLQNPAYLNQIGISNNIITNSFCGWYIDAESFYPPVMVNLAYYDNYYNYNLADPNFQSNPMYLNESPFETPEDPNDWPYFVAPNSPAATAQLRESMLQSPQQMLTTLFSEPTPRGDFGIGYGVVLPESFYSEISVDNLTDFDDDGNVNFDDFLILAADWLTDSNSPGEVIHYPDPNGYAIADVNKSRIVDVVDLEALTRDWLCDGTKGIHLRVEETSERLIITCEDPNLIEGSQFAIFLDGEHLATRDTENNPTFIIDKRIHRNGDHQLLAVVLDEEGHAYVTVPTTYTFDNPLSGITYEKFPDPSKPFIIRGTVEAGNTAGLSIKDMNELSRWSQDFTGDFVAIVDPNQVFGDNDINLDLAYTCVPTLLVQLGQNPPFDEVLADALTESAGSSSILALGGKSTNVVAGLVICMLEDGIKQGANYTDTGTARFAWKTMINKGIPTVFLNGYGTYNEVNLATIERVLQVFTNVRYMHIYAHGNYEADGAGLFGFNKNRGVVQLNDGVWPAHNSRKWTDTGNEVPQGYEYLADSLEKHAPLCSLPFKEGQLRILVVESCKTQRMPATEGPTGLVTYYPDEYEYEKSHYLNSSYNYPYSDFCFAFRITQSNQMILGSAETVIRGSAYPYWLLGFNSFWNELGIGAHTAQDGIDAFIANTTGHPPMHDFRIRGASNLSGIRLTYLNNY
jgi:hypothetical protein